MGNTATTVELPEIDVVFQSTIESICNKIDGMNGGVTSPQMRARIDVVDVELVFKSVAVDGSSRIAKLLVSDKQTSSTLEIRLTTRIRIN